MKITAAIILCFGIVFSFAFLTAGFLALIAPSELPKRTSGFRSFLGFLDVLFCMGLVTNISTAIGNWHNRPQVHWLIYTGIACIALTIFAFIFTFRFT